MLYTLACPFTQERAKIVDAAHVLLIDGAKYTTLNEEWLKFKPVTSCHTGF